MKSVIEYIIATWIENLAVEIYTLNISTGSN